jgi:hypothetical protein
METDMWAIKDYKSWQVDVPLSTDFEVAMKLLRLAFEVGFNDGFVIADQTLLRLMAEKDFSLRVTEDIYAQCDDCSDDYSYYSDSDSDDESENYRVSNLVQESLATRMLKLAALAGVKTGALTGYKLG